MKVTFLIFKILIAVFIVLFIIEIGLRISGKYLTQTEEILGYYRSEHDYPEHDWYYNYQKNDTFTIETPEFSFEYISNELGLREKSIFSIDTNENNIFFFGDSFTEGFGAPYDSSFVRKVESRFHQDNISVSIYNYGKAGSDPFYNYMLLRDYVLDFHPSHVFFMLHSSDVSDVILRGGFERFQEDGTTKYKEAPWFHSLYKHSHFVRFVVHQIFNYDWRYTKIRDQKNVHNNAKILINDCLEKADSLCRFNNIDFTAISFVDSWDLCYSNQSKIFELNQFLDSNYVNYNLIQIDEAMIQSKNAGSCKDISWLQDHHFNSKGYQILGDCVYDKISKKIK